MTLLASLETLTGADSLLTWLLVDSCISEGILCMESTVPAASCILIASWYINYMYLVNKTLKIKGKDERKTTEIMIYAMGFT